MGRLLRAECLEDRCLLATFTVQYSANPQTLQQNLRDAIESANLNAGHDTVDFAEEFHSTLVPIEIVLDVSQDEIFIEEDLTLDGPGAEKLVISGANTDFDGIRIFWIEYDDEELVAETKIRNITLADGFADQFVDSIDKGRPGNLTGNGGAIMTLHSLELRDVVFRDNQADADGGALSTPRSAYSQINFDIERCVFDNNKALGTGPGPLFEPLGGKGGAIHFYGGGGDGTPTVRIVESTITNNWGGTGGGAFLGQDGVQRLEIDRTEFVGNFATSEGGGIRFQLGESFFENAFTIANSNFSNNSAGAESGGVFFHQSEFGDVLVISNTTISGNYAEIIAGGARLNLRGEGIQLVNSTISGNSTSQEFSWHVAGGILLETDFDDEDSEVVIAHSTITNNAGYEGGGLYIEEVGEFTGTVVLGHTIVSDNSADGGTAVNIFGNVNTSESSYNLVGTNGTGGLTGITNLLEDDPMLAPLGDYGGIMLPSGQTISTHHPQIGSPVIDAGDPSLQPGSGAPLYDQRGDGFTRVYTSTPPVPQVIDIGAVEVQEVEEPCPPGDYNRDGVVNAADYVVWRDTLGDIVRSPYEEADGDGSLEIAQPDYGVWYENFGNECEMESAGASMVGIKSNPQTPDNLRVHAVGAMPPMQMMVLDRNASELAQNQPKLFGHELQDGRQQAHGTALLLLYDLPTEAREDGDFKSLELDNLTSKAGEMDSAERLLIIESAIDELFGNTPFGE